MRWWGKIIICLTCFPVLVYGQGTYQSGSLTMQEIERIKSLKSSLYEVDHKTLDQTMRELAVDGHPRLNLQIREVMAKTYEDIVKEQNVQGKSKKEWLYSMIALNMAYLQFGGSPSERNTTLLNRLIRYKLKKYLPVDVFRRLGSRYSLE